MFIFLNRIRETFSECQRQLLYTPNPNVLVAPGHPPDAGGSPPGVVLFPLGEGTRAPENGDSSQSSFPEAIPPSTAPVSGLPRGMSHF